MYVDQIILVAGGKRYKLKKSKENTTKIVQCKFSLLEQYFILFLFCYFFLEYYQGLIIERDNKNMHFLVVQF